MRLFIILQATLEKIGMAASSITKKFDVLFEKRALVAEMLKACIRDKGQMFLKDM